jgi:hypothetical protein
MAHTRVSTLRPTFVGFNNAVPNICFFLYAQKLFGLRMNEKENSDIFTGAKICVVCCALQYCVVVVVVVDDFRHFGAKYCLHLQG